LGRPPRPENYIFDWTSFWVRLWGRSDYLNMRVRIYLRRKHAVGNKGYKLYPYSYLYDTLGLYKIPTTSSWISDVKAIGRR
jgi:hypothetical protein